MRRAGIRTIAALAFALVLGSTSASAKVPAFTPMPGAAQCRGVQGYAEDFDGRRTFLWRPAWLADIAERAENDSGFRKSLVRAGEKALERGPYSVTDKPKLVPGATPHDYASIGPYWWPDTKKRNGLPYVRRDGEVNPERNGPEFDKDRLRSLAADAEALALAHFVTGEDRFAQHASKLLRAWFITPETRMNPQFEFAQGIPGRVNGRGEGLIEASDLSTIVEAIGLLEPSGALSASEHAAIREWYGAFVVWMATSKNGESEMRKANNHGLFYDFYLAHFALFAGAPDAARNVIDAFPDYRMGRQMDRQGRFIAELRRTRSWHYSVFAVEAMARLATIGECVDRDLWTASLPDGRNLGVARGFVAKYAGDIRSWPFPDRDLERDRVDKMVSEYRELERLFSFDGMPDLELGLP